MRKVKTLETTLETTVGVFLGVFFWISEGQEGPSTTASV